MMNDERVYNGILREWQGDYESIGNSTARARLLERADTIGYWILFMFCGRVYYRTFEYHLYRRPDHTPLPVSRTHPSHPPSS